MDFSELPTVRFANPTRENLPRLARLAYDASAIHCGTCRNYHITVPYLRVAGASAIGPDFAWESQLAALLQAMGDRTEVRWLLAGSADAGLLGLIQGVAERRPGTSHHVTIVDRCETPLVLCRDHAAATGWEITAIRADLWTYSAEASADIVLIHFTTIFVPEKERADFLRHCATWIAPGGSLVYAHLHDRSAEGVARGSNPHLRWWRESVLRAEAAAGTLVLPEDIERFVARLDQRRSIGTERQTSLEDGIALLREAGLATRVVVPLPFSAEEDSVRGNDPKLRSFLIAGPQEP